MGPNKSSNRRLKQPEKIKFSSFVAKDPLHVTQVDLFHYSFNQMLDKDDLKNGRSNRHHTD